MALQHADLAAQRAQRRPRPDRGRRVESVDDAEARCRLAERQTVRARSVRARACAGEDAGALDGLVAAGAASPDAAPRRTRRRDPPPRARRRARPRRAARSSAADPAQAPSGRRAPTRRTFPPRRVAATARARSPASAAVPPRLVVVLRREEVERERGRLVLERLPRRRLDRLGDAPVQLAAAAERRAPRRRCRAGACCGTAGRRPGRGRRGPAAAAQSASSTSTSSPAPRRRRLVVEAHAEHRRVAEHDAVGRREPVDLGRRRRPRPSRAGSVVPVERARSAARRGRAGCRPSGARAPRSRAVAAAARRSRSRGSRSRRRSASGRSVEREARQRVVVERPSRCSPGLACDDHERVPARGRRARKPAQQVGARVVHELRVLDDEHQRRVRRALATRKRSDHVREHIAQEALVERRRSRASAARSRPSRIAEQRDPRARAPASASATTSRRRRSARRRVRIAVEAQHLAHEARAARSTASTTRTPRTRRAARARRGVAASELATRRDLPMPEAPPIARPSNRLPVCHIVDGRHGAPRAPRSRPTNGVSAIALVSPARRRRRRARPARAPPSLSPGTGSIGVVCEERPRPLEHLSRRKDLAGLGARHDPRGRVDRVAEDRVRAAVGRAEVAREDAAAADADAHRDQARAVHHLAHEPQRLLLVVPGARRRARAQQHLDRPFRDVGDVERHLVACRSLLDRRDPLVERCGEPGRAELREQLVGSHQIEERSRDHAVLGLAALEEHVLARGDRNAGGDLGGHDLPTCGRPTGRRLRRRRRAASHRPSHVRRSAGSSSDGERAG